MRINSNIPALNAHRVLNQNTNQLGLSLERLSSGFRINRASDDAAGLAISEKMEAQIQGLRQASRNGLDGVSMIQTAEGALDEVHAMLKRMRELSVQGANGIYEDEDLDAIHEEMKALTEEIEKISNDTEFNGIKLLQGNKYGREKDDSDNSTFQSTDGEDGKPEAGETLYLQVGANKDEHIELNMKDFELDIKELGKVKKSDKETDGETKSADESNSISGILEKIGKASGSEKNEAYSEAITVYDNAVRQVSTIRSKLGAIQNRLESTISNLDNTAENLTGAKSRIKDIDMALEMSNFTKYSVLQQASTAMLGEANNLPQSVLQLLQ